MSIQTMKRDIAELKEAIKPDLLGLNYSITESEDFKVKRRDEKRDRGFRGKNSAL
jgi:hypothetical protein